MARVDEEHDTHQAAEREALKTEQARLRRAYRVGLGELCIERINAALRERLAAGDFKRVFLNEYEFDLRLTGLPPLADRAFLVAETDGWDMARNLHLVLDPVPGIRWREVVMCELDAARLRGINCADARRCSPELFCCPCLHVSCGRPLTVRVYGSFSRVRVSAAAAPQQCAALCRTDSAMM